MLGTDPMIFPVSSKQALHSKIEARKTETSLIESPKWISSKFGALEQHILQVTEKKNFSRAKFFFSRQNLSREERTRIKLENPLGIIENLLRKYSLGVSQREVVLKEDAQMLDNIDRQIVESNKEMKREFSLMLER
jgi:hypothetical protein